MKKWLKYLGITYLWEIISPVVRSPSFGDRVCDDLSEELLQYLTIEDKLRLECVSKQFQKTVFKSHKKIVIDNRFGRTPFTEKQIFLNYSEVIPLVINCNRVVNVLKKAPNVSEITIGSNNFIENIEEVLQTVVKHCHHLKTL